MNVSVMMYHYVRDLKRSRYPEIKALETEDFREQIAYIKKHYTVISGADLLAAAAARAWDALPPMSALLTFDDGYRDHFTDVFPILREAGITGCFFPPARCVLERRVLDVNRIHFVLAAVANKRLLVDRIFTMLETHGPRFGTPGGEYYWRNLAVPSRYDGPEVTFIKRMLQRELPPPLTRLILDGLFAEYVTADDVAFGDELYLNEAQIVCMRDAGMYFGSHGYDHYWLDRLSPADQEREIDASLGFLRRIGSPLDGWIMCYPHGAYNDSLVALLSRSACRIGLTTGVGIADLDCDHPLTLPRLNANDLPKRGTALPNDWTLRARANGHRPETGASALPYAAKS